MKPVKMHRAARAELSAHMAYYEQQQPGLGLAFLAEVERVVTLLERQPQLGAPYKQTAFRSLHLRRFPYRLFSLELDDVLWIVAIAHDRRRPDYWQRRRVK
jgi:toxin ParE1/3/4